MARRKYGEGSIFQRKDGRWEGRVVVGYGDNGYPQTKSVTAKTQAECKEKLQALKEKWGRTSDRLKPDMPFGDWIDFWYQNFSKPKTKSSIRTLILPPDMLDILAEHKKNATCKWVFPSPVKEGEPRNPDSIYGKFQKILKRAQCKKIRFHDLRHTFATMAIENGMDIKTLSAMIGHVSAETTVNVRNPHTN